MVRLLVREFVTKDLNRLLEIRRACLDRELGILGSSEESFWKELRLYGFSKLVAKLARRVSFRVYVGEVEGLVVGITILTRLDGAWYISGVMVDPTQRRKGYGKSLVSRACNDARTFGAKKVLLYVVEDNVPAKSLYESLNFLRARERIVSFRRDVGRVNEIGLSSGYSFVKIDPFHLETAKIIESCHNERSKEVYGETRVLSTSDKLFGVIFRVYRALLTMIFGMERVEKYAIVRNSHCVGLYTFNFRSKKEDSIFSLHIQRMHRGKGIEKAAIIKALKSAFKLGAPGITISFDEKNTELEDQTKKLGFTKSFTMDGLFKSIE